MSIIVENFKPTKSLFGGESVLVTGGTGSAGQAIIKRLLTEHNPRKIIVFSRDEQKHFQMQQEFTDSRLRFMVGDVRDFNRLKLAMREVDTVIHTAAMKHVHICEYNPMEAVETNVYGSQNVIMAALENKVKRVVALSTDKSVCPVNLYGATKLTAEKLFISANALSGDIGTRFSCVRYGNVVGSAGSVIPYFLKLIDNGALKLPVTHAEMTRFLITMEQAVDLIFYAHENMQGGETYVPKIPSMRMVDLAAALAPDLPIEIVGIRPGEKLHEVLDVSDAGVAYASNTNDHWLTADDVREMVKCIGSH